MNYKLIMSGTTTLVKGIIWIRASKQPQKSEDECVQIHHCSPVLPENIQTDDSFEIDIGMEDLEYNNNETRIRKLKRAYVERRGVQN